VASSAVDDIETFLHQPRLQQAPGSRTEHHDRKLPRRLRTIGVDMIAAVLKRPHGLSLRELIAALDKEFAWKSTESNVTALLYTNQKKFAHTKPDRAANRPVTWSLNQVGIRHPTHLGVRNTENLPHTPRAGGKCAGKRRVGSWEVVRRAGRGAQASAASPLEGYVNLQNHLSAC
jgi:hypothetical protein